jgi:type IV secretion system protein VirD4
MLDLFNPKLSSEKVLHQASAKCREREHPLVRLPNAIHTAVFSPSGGGKGVSFVIPFLQTCPDSCVVIDFKGENALITAKHREQQFGHRVVLLDPYRVVTKSPDTFNPLDFIGGDDENALDHCNDLAKALVFREGTEPDPHWNDSAEAWITAVIAAVIAYEKVGGERSLQTLRDILSDPQELELAIQAMSASAHWEEMLSRKGKNLRHWIDREKSSTQTTLTRHLTFLDTPAVAASTRTSSFDPTELLTGKMTVYLILPPAHMRAQSALLRVWIGSLLRAVIQGGLQEQRKTHFVLDEAASLGKMDAINDAIDKFRGYGVRLLFFYQSIGQLKYCFAEGKDLTLLSNTSQVHFGVNDMATAEQISSRLGESTIIVESGGRSGGRSRQATYDSQSPHSSSGTSVTDSTNWSQQARKLLKPEEVLQLSPRTAITFTPGVPPVCTTLIRYYEENAFGEQPGAIRRVGEAVAILLKSAGACAASLGTMWFLARMLQTEGAGAITRMFLG